VITPKSVSNDPEKMLFDSHTTTQFFGMFDLGKEHGREKERKKKRGNDDNLEGA
jgi:hypothetical protein